MEIGTTNDALKYLYTLSREYPSSVTSLTAFSLNSAGYDFWDLVIFDDFCDMVMPPSCDSMMENSLSVKFGAGQFFACSEEAEMENNGALFICKYTEYPLFHDYNESLSNSQNLAFVSTNVVNPRMRCQAGCFMMWGHSPRDNSSTETYDLAQYHEKNGNMFFHEKHIIPANAKKDILKELHTIYSIDSDSMFLKDGYLKKEYRSGFMELKRITRLMTLYMTDSQQLTDTEKNEARSCFKADLENMYGECRDLRQIG